jgi:hypothetical protein
MYARWREYSTGHPPWGSCGVVQLSQLQSHIDDFGEQQLQQFSEVANQGQAPRSFVCAIGVSHSSVVFASFLLLLFSQNVGRCLRAGVDGVVRRL